MINLSWAFTPRIRGVLAHDAGSCDRGDGWWVCLASGNPAGYIPEILRGADGGRGPRRPGPGVAAVITTIAAIAVTATIVAVALAVTLVH